MSAFSHLLKDTITVASQTGVDVDQAPTYGTQSTIKARYEPGGKVIRSADGETIQRRDVLYTDTEIDQTDAIWLPGANTSSDDEAQTPDSITESTSPLGSGTLWEVVL